MLSNVIKLYYTTEGLWKRLMKYPQFLISPCFTPFLFEGYKSTNQLGQYKLKIWIWGGIINAIYVGCLSQCILCITGYYKGVHQWKFGDHFVENVEFQILCCPFPNPCINMSEAELDSKEESMTALDKPKNEVYWYTRRGETRIRLLGSIPQICGLKSQVFLLYLQSFRFHSIKN